MEELEKYVEGLFIHQRKSAQVQELKEEILANMVAKKNDLMSQGIDEDEAIKQAKNGLSSIDGLIEDNQLTDMGKYHSECAYTLFLHSILFWIFTMPLLFVSCKIPVYMGLFMTAISAGIYFYRLRCQKEREEAAFLSLSERQKGKKTAWIIWTVFIVVAAAGISLVLWASNIWFHRPIRITGPYELAKIMVLFYVPLLTIFIPMTIGRCADLLSKCERRRDDER